ncbi:MAG TPA: methyltransferase domain-containing protein [Nannocystaceae bacterium]|nr:methyltransferase domain-containing protein [Nannocystaceae bacterium]
MTRRARLLLFAAAASCSGTPTSTVEGNEVGVTPSAATPAPAEPAAPPSDAKESTAPEPVAVVPDERPALDIEYVPTPHNVVAKMLAVAKITKNDVVYDLGCGDGRLVVAAAKKYGARGVGFDLDPERIAEAKANVEKAGVGHLVTIEQKNIFDVDLRPASVVTLYLLPEINVRLIPQLEQLAPGSRIISHDFDMKGVEYDQTWSIIADHHRPPPKTREHYVYKWTTPLKKTPLPDE